MELPFQSLPGSRFGVAVLATVAAVAVMVLIAPLVAPLLVPPFIVAVAIAALYGGRAPGWLATALCAAALGYWFYPRYHGTPTLLTYETMFVTAAAVVVLAGGSVRAQRRVSAEQVRENERLRGLAEEAATEAELATEQAAAAARHAEDEAAKARNAEEAVARLAAIVTSSSDAIVGKTLDGVITSWNAAAERIFGYTAAEMIGDSIFKLIPPEHHAAERELLERLRRGEVVEFSEAERIRCDGRRIWISLSVSPVRDGHGVITGAASIKRDVTEQKLLDERLRAAQRLQAVGQLAGGIAHEANNQMSVVLGGAHFLLRRTDLSDEARADVEQMRQAAERTAAITQQLLAFGRRQMLQLQDVDLNGVVQAIDPVLRRSLTENQALVIRPGHLKGLVRADPRQLEQVLLNLTLNARDAMPDGGELTIETSERDLSASEAQSHGVAPGLYEILVVSDTGVGIQPETMAHMFEPFFTTKPVGQGTGLGLSVVEGIVSQFGGHIRAASGPGHGARFTMYFPVTRLREDATLIPESARPGAPRVGTVLVAEDDVLVRGMAARALAEVGYTVLEAADGRAARDLVLRHQGPLDLVLTDLGMPRMDGIELAGCLQRERPNLPLVFMTGYGDRGVEALKLGGVPTIQKPFSPDGLVRVVEEELAREPASEAGD